MNLKIILKEHNIRYDEKTVFKTYFTELVRDRFKEQLIKIDFLYIYLDRKKNSSVRNKMSMDANSLELDKYLSYVEERNKKLFLKESDFIENIRSKGKETNAFRNAESLYLSSIVELIFTAYRLNKNQFDAAIIHFYRSGYFEGAAYHNPSDDMIKKLEEELGLKIKQETGRKGGKGKADSYEPQKQIVYERWEERKFPSADKCADAICNDPRLKVGARTIAGWIRAYERNKKSV